MLPCHSCHCHIYGIWRGKEVWKALTLSYGVTIQAIRRDNFHGKKGFSLCNTAVLKLYCKSYWVL